MLLPKTFKILQSIKKDIIQDTISDMLKSEGINVSMLDVRFGHSFIYVEISEGHLIPVFLYESCISYRQSKNEGLPKLHFCNCLVIKQHFSQTHRQSTFKNRHYLVNKPKRNAFSFSIRQGLSEVGMYNDYPLELCNQCSQIIYALQEKQNTTIDIFDKSCLALLETHPNARQNEIIALQLSGAKCHKCKKRIQADSQIWMQIQDDVVKLSCC